MIKSLVLAAVTAAGALGATNANAGVSWSVNINIPVVGAIVSDGPGYYGYGNGYEQGHGPNYGRVYAPVPVYAPAPVYAPHPVYRVRPPVAYYPPAVVYRPVPIVYPRYYPNLRHGHDRWEGRRYDGDRGRDGHGGHGNHR